MSGRPSRVRGPGRGSTSTRELADPFLSHVSSLSGMCYRWTWMTQPCLDLAKGHDTRQPVNFYSIFFLVNL